MTFPTVADAELALERHQEALLALPGVNGAGIGIRDDDEGGTFVIHVLVETGRELTRLRQALDGLIGRDTYDIVELGDVTAYDTSD